MSAASAPAQDAGETGKRTAENAGLELPEAKQSKAAAAPDLGDIDDDFDLLLRSGSLDASLERYDSLADEPPPVELPEEQARRTFAERLSRNHRVDAEELPDLIGELQNKAPKWGSIRRVRSAALLFVFVARSTRICRAAFVAEGLQLLGFVLQDGVAQLEKGDASERQEAGMWILACLTLLRALPIGRATMWQHRVALGKPFDRLHKWCSREKSALAAELRGPTTQLCMRWKKQPKPAEQDADPAIKAIRRKVVDMIAQGLAGIPGGGHSPVTCPSPAVPNSPAARLPANTTSQELEAALYSRYSGATAEYRQHARMLRSNLALPGNASLRENVLTGDTTAEELIAMNSDRLAPQTLQEERHREQQEYQKDMIIKEKLMPPPDVEDGKTDYNAGTAPPVLSRRVSSLLGEEGAASLARQDSNALAAPAPEPAGPSGSAQAFRMEPPPTPFREMEGHHHAGHAGVSPGTPEILATPAQGEEDEDEQALIQWLTKPVRGHVA